MAGVGGTRDAIYGNVWKWSKIPLSRYFKCRFWVTWLGFGWWLDRMIRLIGIAVITSSLSFKSERCGLYGNMKRVGGNDIAPQTILLFILSANEQKSNGRVHGHPSIPYPTSHIQHPTPHIEAASSIHRLIDSFEIILQRVSALWANCSVPFRQSAIHCLHAALSLAWIDSIVRLVTNMNSNKATVDVQSSQCDATQRSSLARCQRSLSL